MNPHAIILTLFMMSSTTAADIKTVNDELVVETLVDDFEDGNRRNKFELYWYDFADTAYFGNSKILNFSTDTEDTSGNNYASFKFILGDSIPKSIKDELSNYVGIGTDIASPTGNPVDLSGATGVRFRARSDDSLCIFFEATTKGITDGMYFRTYFIVDTNWSTFTVNFSDTGTFKLPMRIIDRHFDIKTVLKFNWQVADYSWLVTYYREGIPEEIQAMTSCAGEPRLLCIDDVTILAIADINTTANKRTGRILSQAQKKPAVFFDLLGRNINQTQSVVSTPGIHITRTTESTGILPIFTK